MTTSQQRADELLRHWRLLWPLGKEEREKRFAEIAADYRQEDDLRQVGDAVAEDAPLLPAKELDFANLEF